MSTTERVPSGAAYFTGPIINAGEKPSSFERPPYLGSTINMGRAPVLEGESLQATEQSAHRAVYEAREEDPRMRSAELHAHFTKQRMHDIAASIGAIAEAGFPDDVHHAALNFYEAMRVTHEHANLQQPTPLVV
ncbi:MAG TPA: hypothetical protein VLG11_06045 [Candidatus Saccharimonadales bacterium]|nr:hypothetical protein [Candidatus Saccharimonadales bacterium]